MTLTYDIVRFYLEDSPEVIERGVSLEEAQAHCQRDDTHGEDWFDGYRKAGIGEWCLWEETDA